MAAEVPQLDTAGQCPPAAVVPAMHVKAVERRVTPGKHDLQERMEVREGHLAPDKYPPPAARTNAPEDDAELVDAEWCGSWRHTLRVAQRIVPLKGAPRYLALSVLVNNSTEPSGQRYMDITTLGLTQPRLVQGSMKRLVRENRWQASVRGRLITVQGRIL
jgi:hypothetical protein